MADTAVHDTTAGAIARLDPERLAWIVLLISFALFCAICVVTGLGVHYFLFQSTMPMSAIVSVGRGTAQLVEVSDQTPRVAIPEQTLSNNTMLSTDTQSQATISVLDPQQSQRLIAAVTLNRETRLTLRIASRPRYEWSTDPYQVELTGLTGEIEVFVPDALGRNLQLTVRLARGILVYLSQSGRYTLNVTGDQVRVLNRNGVAVLVVPGESAGRSIPPGVQMIVTGLEQGEAEVITAPTFANLLSNSTFENVVQEVPDDWICTNRSEGDSPLGHFRAEWHEGRRAIHLVRGEGANANGETRCFQLFPAQVGLDISGYNYLSVRATFYLSYHSLSACGTAGSECPLTLQIDYVDVSGDNQRWFHGLYAYTDPQATNYPLRCLSCLIPHDQINLKSWYTYDTGNWLDMIPDNQRPRSLLNFQFYASGHQYDVYVSEMSLLAGNVELPANGVTPEATPEATGQDT